MASSSLLPSSLCNNTRSLSLLYSTLPFPSSPTNARTRTNPHSLSSKKKKKKRTTAAVASAIRAERGAMQYRKLGDSDLNISEITLGTVLMVLMMIVFQMTFGEQNTEKEAHEILSYAFENGINALDTAEAVRYVGVSNETSYGVMEFVHASKVEGLPKIVSIQNSYSLLVRCKFEIDLVEVCHPNNCNIGLLAYSPLGGGSLTGKYIDIESEAAKRGRLNLFPGYMERYNRSVAKIEAELRHSEFAGSGIFVFQPGIYFIGNHVMRLLTLAHEATIKYIEVAKKHGLTLVQLALGFARDRPFMTSSIIGATSVDQLKEDIDAFLATERPLPPEVMADIENVFRRYKDPAIL
ncbi:hypothetical protein C3L33_15070, partial [Rhododendron williamsianum]